MSKSPIKKLIFLDGKFFIRIKILAQDLTVQKKQSSYQISFSAKGKAHRFDASFIPDFQFPGSSEIQSMSWGKFSSFAAGENIFYYLQPNQEKCAVMFGPIPNSVLKSELEFDWENLRLEFTGE